jgi:hypothetical protein
MNSESKTEQSTNNTKDGSEICLLDLSQKEPYTNTQKAIMAIKAFVLAYFGFLGMIVGFAAMIVLLPFALIWPNRFLRIKT